LVAGQIVCRAQMAPSLGLLSAALGNYMACGESALVLVDVQRGFADSYWGDRNNPGAEGQMALLLSAWRDLGWPVLHVKHNSRNPASPLHPSRDGNSLQEWVSPRAGERIIEKDVNSAFIGTGLEGELRRLGVTRVVLAGLTTPHCISTTARMAGNLGFDTYVVSDATAAFEWRSHLGTRLEPEEVHFHALAVLHGEFATVVTTSAIIGKLNLPDPSPERTSAEVTSRARQEPRLP
jgi:nicotinamidase-related amidase